jgi:hypothetical protein
LVAVQDFSGGQNFRRFYLNFRRLFKFQIFRLKLLAVLKPPQMLLFEKNFPFCFPARFYIAAKSIKTVAKFFLKSQCFSGEFFRRK